MIVYISIYNSPSSVSERKMDRETLANLKHNLSLLLSTLWLYQNFREYYTGVDIVKQKWTTLGLELVQQDEFFSDLDIPERSQR